MYYNDLKIVMVERAVAGKYHVEGGGMMGLASVMEALGWMPTEEACDFRRRLERLNTLCLGKGIPTEKEVRAILFG